MSGAAPIQRDFPCKGCIVQVPAAEDAGAAAPLLLALHGDSHDAGEMLTAWQAVANAHGAVLFAPTCPKELKCPGGSWWRWYQSSAHDPGWLSRQLDAVRASVNVDPARIYATGYSGGSSYLGFWAPAHSAELAAVGYVSGGYPYAESCGSCKIPVRAVIGAADGMRGPYVEPLLRYFESCGGHDVSTRIVPALGHKGMLAALPAGEAESLWTWFSSHSAQCLPEAGGLVAAAAPSVGTPASVGSASVTLGEPHVARGCGCELAPASSTPWTLGVLLVITCVRALRPRTRPHRARTRARRCSER